jgi:hypothetical protein
MRRLLAAVAFAIPVVGNAHHGWSEYDSANTLKLTGKIVESGYEHPHGHVRFEAVGGDAKAGKTWNVVLAPPSRMEYRGLKKEMLQPGTSATVEGYANRNKPEEMRAERITIEGKTFELR